MGTYISKDTEKYADCEGISYMTRFMAATPDVSSTTGQPANRPGQTT